MYPTLHYEGAIGFVVAMTDSIKLVGFIPSHTKKFIKKAIRFSNKIDVSGASIRSSEKRFLLSVSK